MNRSEAIEIARSTAAWDFFEIADSNHGDIDSLVDLMQAAAKFEREECAKACEHVNATTTECPEMALHCADAIRMRSNVEVQGPGAASSRTVPCNDGLEVAVPPAPTSGKE